MSVTAQNLVFFAKSSGDAHGPAAAPPHSLVMKPPFCLMGKSPTLPSTCVTRSLPLKASRAVGELFRPSMRGMSVRTKSKLHASGAASKPHSTALPYPGDWHVPTGILTSSVGCMG